MTPDVVVDIGNTRIKWGRVREGRIAEVASLSPDEALDWQRRFDAWQPLTTWVLTGVQPTTGDRLRDWLRERGQSVHVLESYRQLPIRVNVELPEKVGLDRLLDAVAVNERRGPDHGGIIIDAGTAVTVDFVDASGAFRGGAIMPGLRLMAQSLHRHTALLPLITVETRSDPPGTSTVPAMHAGVFHAVLGGIESLVKALRKQSPEPCDVYFGGGDAHLLAPHLSFTAEVWDTMTLEGIRRSAEALS